MIPPADQPTLDVVTVAVIIITALAGGEVARVAGPYAVIVVSALVGAVVALMRRREYSVGQSIAFTGLVTCAAVLVTGALSLMAAMALNRVLGIDLDARFLLVPIAFGIAAVGPDWPDVGQWAAGLLRRRVERAASRDAQGDDR